MMMMIMMGDCIFIQKYINKCINDRRGMKKKGSAPNINNQNIFFLENKCFGLECGTTVENKQIICHFILFLIFMFDLLDRDYEMKQFLEEIKAEDEGIYKTLISFQDSQGQ